MPTGQIKGRLLRKITGQAHQFHRMEHPAANFLAVQTHLLGTESDLFIYIFFKNLVLRVLKTQPYLKAYTANLLAVLLTPNILAVHIDFTALGLYQAV